MNIAIAGFGVEGQSNYAYWAKDPSHTITIVDERPVGDIPNLPDDVPVLAGENIFSELRDFDLVIRTAGLAPHKITTNGKIWSATNEFFALCPAPIIGVTGSKGKGTTSSLIASILEAAGKKVWLVGNIGIAALDVLDQIHPDDVVVYELSSFQLWDLEKSPHIAVVLMIEQEHLDVHRDMNEYVEAKAQITRWQTEDDLLIFNDHNQYSQRIAASNDRVRKIGFPSRSQANVSLDERVFKYGDQAVSSIDDLRIPGEHNYDNAMAAINAVWPFTQDPAVIKAGLNNFKGLPHRLAYVATVNDVDYYDDSIATTPTSAIAGLRAFPDRQKVIILGGSYKGSDFSELAEELPRHDVRAILIGAEAPRIAQALDAVHFTHYEIVTVTEDEDAAQVFTRRAAELATAGSVVLLSPAAASFGLFKNYADRGDRFIAAVTALTQN
jgi:UDP-N-acetylmuramoylalanine--D-glutamate ligase